MIDITTYLEKIFSDFKNYIDENVCLCKLKGLNFEAGALPNYEDINIQQLYLLRYAFVYAFEYSQMYLSVLSQMSDVQQISVTSVGCGSMVDYWALVHALERKKVKNCRIQYLGIDEIDWNYKFRKREEDEVNFQVKNAKDYFSKNQKLSSDVYFFPKSISEFSKDEMEILANVLESKPILKDRFFVCISLREDPGSMNRDMLKTQRIINAIEKNGFTSKCSYTQRDSIKDNSGIIAYDEDFYYPKEALEFVTKINEECAKYRRVGENCDSDCKKYLDRWPTLRTDHIRYQVIMFERK